MTRYEVPREMLVDLLKLRGFIDVDAPTDELLESATHEYQQFHGLRADGWAGTVTQRSLEAPRFCGLPDRLELGDTLCRWGHKNITWTITGQLPRIAAAELRAAYEQAWGYWAEVCDINPQFVESTANVRMGSGDIDRRPGGTLAWSELPCGNQSSLEQKYDTSESWVIAANPPPNAIDLVRVAAHEIGHALGIPHIGAGNLLAPIYSQSIRKPQSDDIDEAVRRYGRRTAPPPIPPPSGDYLEVSVGGNKRRLELQ